MLTGLLMHHHLGMTTFNASIVAYVAGFFVSYFGHRNYTFRSPGQLSRSMPRFLVVSALGLVFCQVIVYLLVDRIGVEYWIALLVMVVTVPASTYLLSRAWAFNDGAF